jgi:hypothetical protein
METKARYGRGGFLGLGRPGQLRLTEEAIEWRSNKVDALSPAEVSIPLRSIEKVSRAGRFPLPRFWLPAWFLILLLFAPVVLLWAPIAFLITLFIKNWVEVRASGQKYPFGVRRVALAKEWLEAINERRRSLAQAQ